MLAYAVAMFAVSLVPVAVGDLRALYLAVAVTGGVWLVRDCSRHVRRLERATARRVFLGSLSYLGALFVASAVDITVL
jgi:heme O synthase-like polyprenyltransferase